MSRSPIRLLVLSAGLSSPSSTRMLADQLSSSAREALGTAGRPVEVRTIELRELAHDAMDTMLSRFPVGRMEEAVRLLEEADAVIAVTPIFNTTASGLFKTFLDAVDMRLWADKPVLLGATAGTARHSLALEYALRPIFVHLKAAVVPTAVFAASADFGAASTAEADAPLAGRSRRAATELAAMLAARSGEAAGPGAAERQPEAGAERQPEAEAESAAPEPVGVGARSQRPMDLDAEFADFVPMDRLLGR